MKTKEDKRRQSRLKECRAAFGRDGGDSVSSLWFLGLWQKGRRRTNEDVELDLSTLLKHIASSSSSSPSDPLFLLFPTKYRKEEKKHMEKQGDEEIK